MKKVLVILAVVLLVMGCFCFVACTNVDNETVSDAMTIANLKSEVNKAFDKLSYVTDLVIDSERGVISFSVENSVAEITVSEINLSSGSISATSTDGRECAHCTDTKRRAKHLSSECDKRHHHS